MIFTPHIVTLIMDISNNLYDIHDLSYIQHLNDFGYAIIPNILTHHEIAIAKNDFLLWLNSNPHIIHNHSNISPHGILKFYEVGHQRHAWFIRTRPNVINVFKNLWNSHYNHNLHNDDLVVSFDGSCWIHKHLKKNDKNWTHTDQGSKKIGLHSYQAFVSLTSNKQRTLVVYEASHKLHEHYMIQHNISHSKNWLKIDPDFLDKIKHTKKVLHVPAGSLVIWDSRTFHQNQYGFIHNSFNHQSPLHDELREHANVPEHIDVSKAPEDNEDGEAPKEGEDNEDGEERIVQYVSYLPRIFMNNSMKNKRLKYFHERRTTSHWAYPINVNSLQPQVYGDKSKLIDYSSLNKPYLDDLIQDIYELI